MVRIEGRGDTPYQPVVDAFAAAFESRPSMGAALAVYKNGKEVVSVWGGLADPRRDRPWTESTASVIFSCTKGLMSLLVARLVDVGLLDYDAPVIRYWPEFGQAGKADVTVGQLLAHQAGLSALTVDLGPEAILYWETMTRTLAAQAPLWPLGSGYAYHALTHGWLAGELVRRVTGVMPGTIFERTVTTPLKAEAWIGLPISAQDNVAHLQVSPQLDALWKAEAARDSDAHPNWGYRAMTLGHALPAALVTETGGFNDPKVQAAQIPGAGGIASARALAAIWSAAVTETRGVHLVSGRTITRATATMTEGPPLFDPVPPYSRWGMGFQLDSEARRYLTAGSFGHDGAGGQVGFADPQHKVGFGFVTNWMEAGEDRRATAVIDALRKVLVNTVA